MTKWPAATAMRFSDDQATALGYDGEVTSEASWNRDAIKLTKNQLNFGGKKTWQRTDEFDSVRKP